MSPEQAQMMLQMNCQDAASESQTTRKVIAAVPSDKGDYTPDPKSMNALDLAWHIASSEIWFLEGVAAGKFSPGDPVRPPNVATSKDVLAYYDANFGPALKRAQSISSEDAAKIIDFYGVFQLPAVVYVSFLLKHSIHHRGQLSAYLRPMGAKVPSIYGGSADEPFQMGSTASA